MRRLEGLIEKLKDLHVRIGGKAEPLSKLNNIYIVDSKGEAFKADMYNLRESMKSIKEKSDKRKQIIKESGFYWTQRLSN